jgi:NAD(P)H-dependent FMN reductase
LRIVAICGSLQAESGNLALLKTAAALIVSGELEQKVVAITAAVAGPERGRRGLEALRETLSAVRATIVGGAPIVRGPGMECQVAA